MELNKTPSSSMGETTKYPAHSPELTTVRDMISPQEEEEEESSYNILIPLAVLLGILIMTLLVCLMLRNRRRLAHIYCKRRQGRPYGHQDDGYDSPLEQDTVTLEEEDNEVDNEDNPTKSLLRGKLQINNRYENYFSTSHLNKSSSLFT